MICNKLYTIDRPSQFGFNRCNWIGEAISAAASHINAGLNYITQRNTNKRNQDIAHEANVYNWKMLQEQERYNTEMWNKQVAYNDRMNEYNSASQQRKRLEEAGLNPYMMMDGGSSGTASTSTPSTLGVNPQGATAIPEQAPQFNIGFDGASFDNYLLNKELNEANARKLNAEAEHTEIDNQSYGVRLMQMVDNMISDTHDKTASAALKQFQIQQGSALLGSQLRVNNSQADLLQRQAQTEAYNTLRTKYDAFYSRSQFENYPIRFKKEMAELDSRIYSNYQSGNLSLAEANLAHEQAFTEQVRRYGLKQDNYIKRFSTAQASWEARDAKYRSMQSYLDYKNSSLLNDPLSKFYLRLMNTVAYPIRGIFSGSVSKSFK